MKRNNPALNKETILLWVIILLAVAFSTLPVLIGYAIQPPDRQFMGVVAGVEDWAQYMSWMKAHTTALIIENPLTPEAQTPAFFNLQWFILAQIWQFTKLPSVLLVQVFRLAVAVAFMVLTFRLSAAYFKTPWERWAAWLVVCFAAGLGWIKVIIKQFTGVLPNPTDVYAVEPVSFQNIAFFPHFVLAAILITSIFWLVVLAFEKHQLRYGWLAGLISFILGWTHAYDLIIIYGVVALFIVLIILRDGLSWFPILVGAQVLVCSFIPPIYFVYLTSLDPVWKVVLDQFALVQVYTPNFLGLIILMGIPLLLAVFTWDGFLPLRQRTVWSLMIRAWALANFALLYFPADYQIHMLNAWQIPVAFLAVEGLYGALFPALRAFAPAVWLRGLLTRLMKPLNIRWIAAVVLVISVLPANAYLYAWRTKELFSLPHTHYLYKDEVQVLQWLDANACKNDIVLSGLAVGMHIPGVSGNKVFLGHWAQTVDFYAKQELVYQFFSVKETVQSQTDLIDQYQIGYIFWGRDEQSVGGADPAALPGTRLVYETPQTRLYQTGYARAPQDCR